MPYDFVIVGAGITGARRVWHSDCIGGIRVGGFAIAAAPASGTPAVFRRGGGSVVAESSALR